MNKYSSILDELLRSIEKRRGEKPTELANRYKSATEEGMCREGICQILVGETWKVRWKIFCLYPELVIPYFNRIR